jgi:AcrR family transcriptional regulator
MTELPTPSRQQKRTEKTRTRLLDAALEVFLERGYHETSIGEITQRADLGAGTYYLHFKDKRGLYEALVRRDLMTLRATWMDERAKRKVAGKAWAEIALMVEMVLDSLLADMPKARLVLLDGPPLETWLVEEVGRLMAEVVGAQVTAPELLSNLVIGATLNAGRWAVTSPRTVSTKRLVADTVAFCAAGVEAASPSRPKR